MKSQNIITSLVLIFVIWNFVIYFWLGSSQPSNVTVSYEFSERLSRLQTNLEEQMDINQQLLQELDEQKEILKKNQNNILSQVRSAVKKKKQALIPNESEEPKKNNKLVFRAEEKNGENEEPDINQQEQMARNEDLETNNARDNPVIPILVIACNRPEAITRSLTTLINNRPSPDNFPIVVSQDCGHAETADAIRKFSDQITFIQQPNLGPIKDIPSNMKKFEGYYKISRHYRFALGQIFDKLNHEAVIIVEDDLDIAVDFFEYFAATYHLLREDKSLWCISAWNDNGKENLVSDEADLLYRSDFFPGLGWMMTKGLWQELRSKWPAGFWDDWMRDPKQRRDRACIRPELSRTKTFGRIGVSNGQFYDRYLKYIKLNEKFVPFTKTDLSYLKQAAYDDWFLVQVYDSPEITLDRLKVQAQEKNSVRLNYSSLSKFKSLAEGIGIMADLKSGVPRGAYHGIVSIMFDERRVYLAPPENWEGYDRDWS